MADRRREPEPQAPTADARASAPAAQPDESTYSRDELMAGAAGFGVQAETVAGAWHLAGFPLDKAVTRSQMEAAIDAFNTREVGPKE